MLMMKVLKVMIEGANFLVMHLKYMYTFNNVYDL